MAGRRGGGASRIGMMEGAFFVPRTELLAWANKLLSLSLTKVEQCASGAVYCQIVDSCHPGTVSMKKVNWMAKADHEYVPNYKLLQAAFDKNGIERNIDVDKLIRAKYQDNLEFLQFMKCYWEYEGAGRDDYDPCAARDGKQLPTWALPSGAVDVPRAGGKENLRPRRPVETEGRPPTGGSRASPSAQPAMRAMRTSPGGTSGGSSEAQARAAVQQELEELRNTVEGLEHERDYYFKKLREVEILCSSLQSRMEETETLPDLTHKRILTDIQDILYAENDDGGGDGEDEVGPA